MGNWKKLKALADLIKASSRIFSRTIQLIINQICNRIIKIQSQRLNMKIRGLKVFLFIALFAASLFFAPPPYKTNGQVNYENFIQIPSPQNVSEGILNNIPSNLVNPKPPIPLIPPKSDVLQNAFDAAASRLTENSHSIWGKISQFFSSDELSINDLINETTLNLLVDRVSARLPAGQQVIREIQTIKETLVKETKTVIDSQEVLNLQNSISKLQARVDSNYQSLFQSVALSNRINTLSGVTISSPTFSAGSITDSDVPDTITASNYLPLGGGTLTGTLLANTSAPIYASSTFQATGDSRFYGSLTVDGTTNLAGISISSVSGDLTVT